MTDFFRIPERHDLEPYEIVSYVEDSLREICPNTFADKAMSDDFGSENDRFFISDGEHPYIWVRIFTDSLDLAGLDLLKKEKMEVEEKVLKFKKQSLAITPFVFFAAGVRGVPYAVKYFPESWHFYEYSLLQARGKLGFALKKHGKSAETYPLSQDAEQDGGGVEKQQRPIGALSEEEHRAIIDFSLSLKRI